MSIKIPETVILGLKEKRHRYPARTIYAVFDPDKSEWKIYAHTAKTADARISRALHRGWRVLTVSEHG